MKPDRASEQRRSPKMRQLAYELALQGLWPWGDEAAVATVLQGRFGKDAGWAAGHYREAASALRQSVAAGVPADQGANVVGFMLHNLIAGREATDYGAGWEMIVDEDGRPAVPRSTRARYSDAHQWLRDSLQYDLDLAALVNGGRSIEAARRWLERHPDLHAKDAPAPRKRRAA